MWVSRHPREGWWPSRRRWLSILGTVSDHLGKGGWQSWDGWWLLWGSSSSLLNNRHEIACKFNITITKKIVALCCSCFNFWVLSWKGISCSWAVPSSAQAVVKLICFRLNDLKASFSLLYFTICPPAKLLMWKHYNLKLPAYLPFYLPICKPY